MLGNIAGLSQALVVVVAATQAVAFQPRLRPALGWLSARSRARVAAVNGVEGPVNGVERPANGREGPSFGTPTLELGTVLSVQDAGLIIVESRDETQTAATNGRIVRFTSGAEGVVVCVRPPLYFVQALPGFEESVQADTRVDLPENSADGSLKIPVGMVSLGRTVNFLGQPTGDDTEPAKPTKRRTKVFEEEPSPESRAAIDKGLDTGLTTIEALTPMGLGQSMLVIGNDAAVKRSIATDLVRSAAAQGLSCVVACLDGDAAEIRAGLAAVDGGEAALDRTAVFTCAKDANLAVKLLTATSAIAAAESFRNAGTDALVVLDDLSAARDFWDFTSRVLLDKFGSERVDMMSDAEQGTFYSAIVRRSAQLDEMYGGGSLTLVGLLDDQPSPDPGMVDVTPEVSADGYDMSAFDGVFYSNSTRARLQLLVDRGIPITDDVCTKLKIPPPKSRSGAVMLAKGHVDKLISTVDGHLTLSSELADAGQYPPVDPSQSLSRVGNQKEATEEGRKRAADSKRGMVSSTAMRKVTAKLRLELAAQQDLRFNADAASAAAQGKRIAAWQAALNQAPGSRLPLGEQVLGLLAASNGLLDEAADPRAAVAKLQAHARATVPQLLDEVAKTMDVTDEVAELLCDIAKEFLNP